MGGCIPGMAPKDGAAWAGFDPFTKTFFFGEVEEPAAFVGDAPVADRAAVTSGGARADVLGPGAG